MNPDPGFTPPLSKDAKGVDLPIEIIKKDDKTAYIEIEMEIQPPHGGQKAKPMTALFAPNPTTLTGDVNVVLWLHGDKSYWINGEKHHPFSGETIQYYLNTFPMCKLRELILPTGKNFLLVAPTLNDMPGGRKGDLPGGLLRDPAKAEVYLRQALNGANKYLGVPGTKLGKIVLAAHSGGGNLQGIIAEGFGGKTFDKMNEVWCFDSTYWGGSPFIAWAGKGHDNARLFVYSNGVSGNGSTGDSARAILKLRRPDFPPKAKSSAKSKVASPLAAVGAGAPDAVNAVGAGVRNAFDNVKLMMKDPKKFNTRMTKIDAVIPHDPDNDVNPAWAAYGGDPGGHYESIQAFLPQLVKQSQNLN